MQEAVTDLTWQKEPSVRLRWIVILSLVTNVVFLSSANHISKSDLRGGRWGWYRFQDDDVDEHLEEGGGEDEDDSVGDEELIQMPPTRSTAHHQGVSQPEHYAMHHSPWCVLNHSSTRSVPLWCSLYQESSNTGVHCTERLVLVNLVHCSKSLGWYSSLVLGEPGTPQQVFCSCVPGTVCVYLVLVLVNQVHCSRSVVFVHLVQCHWPHPRPPNQQAPRGLPSTQPLPAMKPTSQNILNFQL